MVRHLPQPAILRRAPMLVRGPHVLVRVAHDVIYAAPAAGVGAAPFVP